MKQLPTPDEWNKENPTQVIPPDYAPVACPRCGAQMIYPDQRDYLSDVEVVRCPQGCIQTTINRKI